jgi:hypothetical protein
MFIIYRRTGGVLALITLGAVVLAVTLLTAAVVATLALVAIAIGALVLVARAVLPTSWWPQAVTPPTAWPRETIEASLATPMVSLKATDSRDDDVTSGSRLHS